METPILIAGLALVGLFAVAMAIVLRRRLQTKEDVDLQSLSAWRDAIDRLPEEEQLEELAMWTVALRRLERQAGSGGTPLRKASIREAISRWSRTT